MITDSKNGEDTKRSVVAVVKVEKQENQFLPVDASVDGNGCIHFLGNELAISPAAVL